jgi:hypothetical protein
MSQNDTMSQKKIESESNIDIAEVENVEIEKVEVDVAEVENVEIGRVEVEVESDSEIDFEIEVNLTETIPLSAEWGDQSPSPTPSESNDELTEGKYAEQYSELSGFSTVAAVSVVISDNKFINNKLFRLYVKNEKKDKKLWGLLCECQTQAHNLPEKKVNVIKDDYSSILSDECDYYLCRGLPGHRVGDSFNCINLYWGKIVKLIDTILKSGKFTDVRQLVNRVQRDDQFSEKVRDRLLKAICKKFIGVNLNYFKESGALLHLNPHAIFNLIDGRSRPYSSLHGQTRDQTRGRGRGRGRGQTRGRGRGRGQTRGRGRGRGRGRDQTHGREFTRASDRFLSLDDADIDVDMD